MSQPPSDDGRAKVLLVDDRLENLVALTTVLAGEDLHVITANSGAEALKLILRQDFILVLMDVLMPQMDGLETAGLIHAREASRHLPIIFLTAAGDDLALSTRGYAVGAVDYLLKPFDPDMLRAKVRVFVELHQQKRAVEARQEALRRKERALGDAALERSEALLEATFREADVGVGHLSKDHRWLRVNRRLAQLLGQRADALVGRPFGECLLDATDGRATPKSAGAGVWRRADVGGPTQVLDFKVSPLPLGHMGAATAVAVVEDISPRWLSARRQEVLIACSERLLDAGAPEQMADDIARRVVPTLGQWCWIELVGEDTRQVAYRAGWHESADGRDALRALWGRRSARGATALGKALAPDAVWHSACSPAAAGNSARSAALAELVGLGAGGVVVVPLTASGTALGWLAVGAADAAGPPAADDVATAIDLGHRLALALENARLLKAARGAIAVRDEFMSIASHELRTPLTPLLLQLQRLRPRGAAPTDAALARVATIARSAEKQVRRLAALVDDLLDVTRISSGQLAIRPEEVDLGTAACDVAQRFGEKLTQANSSLRLDIAEDVVGWWDPLRLDQVIVNLLSNAIKYGDGQPIELRVRRAHNHASLTVEDHGIGIPAARMPHIFGRFERATSSRRHGGLGLGLYIVDQIVQAHHGSVEVDSLEAQGSRFTVSLPLVGPSVEPVTSAARQA